MTNTPEIIEKQVTIFAISVSETIEKIEVEKRIPNKTGIIKSLLFNTSNFSYMKLNLQENEIDILQKSAKVRRDVISAEESDKEKGTFFLTIDATHFKITFWIGFISIEEAQIFRNEMKLQH